MNELNKYHDEYELIKNYSDWTWQCYEEQIDPFTGNEMKS